MLLGVNKTSSKLGEVLFCQNREDTLNSAKMLTLTEIQRLDHDPFINEVIDEFQKASIHTNSSLALGFIVLAQTLSKADVSRFNAASVYRYISQKQVLPMCAGYDILCGLVVVSVALKHRNSVKK